MSKNQVQAPNVNLESQVQAPNVNLESQVVPPEKKESEGAIPYARFKEVNDAKIKAESELQKLNEARKKAADEEAKKRGDFEKLLSEKELELAAAKEKAEQWDAYQKTRREVLLSKLPEDQREIYQDMPLIKLEKHIELISIANTQTNKSTPGLPTHGYTSLTQAANDRAHGIITQEKYEQIRSALTQ